MKQTASGKNSARELSTDQKVSKSAIVTKTLYRPGSKGQGSQR